METKIAIDFTNSCSNMDGVLDRKQTRRQESVN